MSQSREHALRTFGSWVLLVLILSMPSIWLCWNISPLWKDVDAYLQVTSPPSSNTFLQYGPLYCLFARLPLFAGYFFDCLRAGLPLPAPGFFARPILCDSGVRLLIYLQHCGFCLASLFLINTATRSSLVRFILALLWASNPVFYIWMHCVGSESLSLVLTLLLATISFRLARYGRLHFRRWFVFGILLTLAMLTRHINGVLAALLPLLFSSAAAMRWLQGRRDRAWRDIRLASFAIGLGVIAIVATSLSKRAVSAASGIPYYNRIGFTYLFRLDFLAPLSFEDRARLLDGLERRTASPEVHAVLSALRDAPAEVPHFVPMKLLEQIQERLPPEIANDDRELTEVLNQTAYLFQRRPSQVLLEATAHDFLRSQTKQFQETAGQAFLATSFYFEHPDTMPQCAGLETFAGKTLEEVRAPFKQHAHLRYWKTATYPRLLLVCLTSLGLIILFAKRQAALFVPCTVAFVATGLAAVIATSVVDEYQARFTLPMWELTIIALTLMLGALAPRLGAAIESSFRAR